MTPAITQAPPLADHSWMLITVVTSQLRDHQPADHPITITVLMEGRFCEFDVTHQGNIASARVLTGVIRLPELPSLCLRAWFSCTLDPAQEEETCQLYYEL